MFCYDSEVKKQSHRKALNLSIFTVAYNIIEGFVAVSLGLASGSSALLGFGLDSFAESLSGGIMIWRFGKHQSDEAEASKEKTAYKLVGYSFLILGAYILYEATSQLVSNQPPKQTPYGIIIAIVSLLVMPFLFRAKYRLGKQIGSESLVADSKQTLACMMMSVTLLIGAGLYYYFEIWWADPIAGAVIALLLIREGLEIRKGEFHH